MINFNTTTGTMDWSETPFCNGAVNFIFEHRIYDSRKLSWRDCDNSHLAVADNLVFRVNIDADTFSVSVENQNEQSLKLAEIVIRFNASDVENRLWADDCYEYIHDMGCRISGVKKVGLKDDRFDSNPQSSMVYVICDIRREMSYLFGVAGKHAGDYVKFKAVHLRPHMQGEFGLEIASELQCHLSHGKSASITRICMTRGKSPLVLLDEYGSRMRSVYGNIKIAERIYGWNSWDYYGNRVSADDIRNNMAASAELLDSARRHIIIDDGWAEAWGRWVEKSSFGTTLSELCREIAECGFVPGIWIAPLKIDSSCKIFSEHPQWLARDENGEISLISDTHGNMGCLDVTRQDVREYLAGIFRRLTNCGFRYLKIDFTQDSLQCKRFYDQAVPRGRIIRMLFELIRETVGPDVYILSCGAPFESVVGLVDGVRGCGDIHTFWSHVMRNASTLSARWWMQNRVCSVDPDFLVVRTTETSDALKLNPAYMPKPYQPYAWCAGREWNMTEMQAYALLIYLTGGDMILSDNLTALNDKGRQTIRKILSLPVLEHSAVPVDLFEHHSGLPAIFCGNAGTQQVIGVFNWSEESMVMLLDCEKYGIENFKSLKTLWGSGSVNPSHDKIEITLPPKSAEGLFFVKTQKNMNLKHDQCSGIKSVPRQQELLTTLSL